MAVRDQRARVLYRLPEQRRFGAGSMPTLLTLVLLAVVLFLGGLVVGRATMTRDQAATRAPVTTAAAAAAGPAPTVAAAPSSTAAPHTQAAAASSGVGPRRVANGVGVGYAHSQQGAVAADRAQVLLRATPVGWRVEQYSNASARVAIWVTSVGGSLGGDSGTVPVREGWGTTTVSLRWVGGDWKQVQSATTDGPVPIADVAPPTAAGELVSKANEFKEFTYAPGP